MRGEDDFCTPLDDVLDRGKRGPYTCVIHYLAVLDRNVEIHTDKYAFAGDVDIFDSFLVHSSEFLLEQASCDAKNQLKLELRALFKPDLRFCHYLVVLE